MGKKHSRSVVPVARATEPVVERRDSVVPQASWQSATSALAVSPLAYPLTVIEAAGIGAVRRCVTLIAGAIAGQRWGEWVGRERIDPPSRLVRRPSAMMTRREWVWRVVASMALDDISYLYMTGGVDDEGIPGSLIPLPRQFVSPVGFVDPYGIFPPTQYWLAGADRPTSSEYILPVRSAFWPGVPPHLIGILQMARNSMMAAWSSDIYAARYWQAGGAPTTVLTTEQELIGTQAEELGNRWRDRRSKGPDFPAVLGKGAKAVPWGADISNAVATDARREIALEIANLFGVNGRYINITPSGQSQSYSNVQDEALNLERFTLASFIDPIQDVVSDLLPEDRNMLIDTTRLTRAGQESRFRAWQIATGNKAWMMPEEVRQEEGLGPSDEIQAFQDAAVEGAKASADAMAEGPQPPIAKPQEKVPVDA